MKGATNMKRYTVVIAVLVAIFLVVSYVNNQKDAVTEEMLEHAYGSGYEAGMEAADEARYHANKSSTLPVENREPTVDMVSTPNPSCFSSVGYDYGTLYVTFRDSGSVYSYENVPSYVYDELWGASSMGSYYNSYIKGYYECHRLS
jgi:hypothetical protein